MINGLTMALLYLAFALAQSILVCRSMDEDEPLLVVLFVALAPVLSLALVIEGIGRLIRFALTVGKNK